MGEEEEAGSFPSFEDCISSAQSLACHHGDRRARSWPARHRPFFHTPTHARARLNRRGHTAGRSSLCPRRSLCTEAHFGVSSCISMAASLRLVHRCLYLDSCIPTPCIPMPALRPNPGHLTVCGSLAGPGPKLTTCFAASMVLRRQPGEVATAETTRTTRVSGC